MTCRVRAGSIILDTQARPETTPERRGFKSTLSQRKIKSAIDTLPVTVKWLDAKRPIASKPKKGLNLKSSPHIKTKTCSTTNKASAPNHSSSNHSSSNHSSSKLTGQNFLEQIQKKSSIIDRLFLAEVYSQNNMMIVRIADAMELQNLAKRSTDEKLQCLESGTVQLHLPERWISVSLIVYLNGEGTAKNLHVSVFIKQRKISLI